MEEQVRFADHAPGAALYKDSLEAAIFLITAEGWQMVHVKVDVARNVEVHEAVAVVVGPGRSGAEAGGGHAGFVGDVFKFAISQVAIKRVSAEAGNIDVRQAVIVIVGHGHAHSPTFACQARRAGDVGEFEIRILVVERDHGVAALAIAVNGGPVHRDDVELAIVIAVDQAGAAAHGFDNVFLFRSRNVGDRQTGLFRQIFEMGDLGLRRLGVR